MTLDARLSTEAAFQDERTHKKELRAAFYVGGFSRVKHELWSSLARTDPATVVELGCGPGENLREARRKLLKLPRHLIALDLSWESVQKANQNHSFPGEIVQCVRGDAERLCLADASVDVIYGFGILHHLKRAQVYPELRRVLRPGGRALFLEPLSGNWFLDLFRKLTPRMRSPFETPLRWQELDEARRHFQVEHREFLLTGIIASGLGVILRGRVKRAVDSFCWNLDERLIKRWPALRRWCWISFLELRL